MNGTERETSTAPSDSARAADILGAVRFAAESFLTDQEIGERMDEVLAALGAAADVSRVYVFANELAADGDLITSQRYEWAARDVFPQLSNPLMQRMSYERQGLERWSETLSRGDVYETRQGRFTPAEEKFARPQQIQSMLFVPLFVEGSWWGFMGFDEVLAPREWGAEEVDALRAAGSILSAGIQGQRARRERQRLLDEQRAFAEAAWRRAAEWEAVLSSMVDGVLVMDTEQQITFANEGARRIMGAQRAEDLLRPCSEYVIFAEMLDMAGRHLDISDLPPCRALRGEDVDNVGMQLVLRSTRERKFIRVSSAPNRDSAGVIIGAVALITDVTEAVEFSRLKDQFVRVAAHELKTPVAIMKGYSQLALRVADEMSATQQERLQAIDRGADRIDRIIQDLLGVSQVYAEGFRLSLKRADLRDLTVAAIGAAAKEFPDRRIELDASEPAMANVDTDRIEYVLRSLLDNAIRYSPAGGPIEVEVSTGDVGDSHLQGTDAPRAVTISIGDRGVGIPPSKQAFVFEPFFRAHTDTPYDYGGMGVGLFTSREIVRQHGGAIWFESVEDRGSTFYVQLPSGGGDERGAQGADRG